jgi:hypothetical protein
MVDGTASAAEVKGAYLFIGSAAIVAALLKNLMPAGRRREKSAWRALTRAAETGSIGGDLAEGRREGHVRANSPALYRR